MKQNLKTMLNVLPFCKKITAAGGDLLRRIEASKRHKKLRGLDRKDIFTDYYRTNYWSSDESRSGTGSTLEYTENLRKEIPGLIEQFQIRSILDAPCGDYNWFGRIQRGPEITYVGGDIVAELINANNDRYRNENTSFSEIDIINDKLPAADLWICRDALFHFSTEDIFSTFRNFAKSEIKYILTTSHHECMTNTDIPTGDYRLLNLTIAPFDLPQPITAIDDWVEGFPPRQMCLWQRETIARLFS